MADNSGEATRNDQQTVSLGEQLRRAREAKKLTVEKVASELRVKKDIIRHLEAENWSALYGRTYARGYFINYVKYLGLPQNVLMATFNIHYQTVGNDIKDELPLPIKKERKRAVNSLFIAFSVMLISSAFYLFMVTDEHSVTSSIETEQNRALIQEQRG